MSGLGPIDRAVLPAEVRTASKTEQEQYTAALGFERMLTGQLTKQLADTTKPADGEEQSAASTQIRSMLPDVLADAITQNGGLGLAEGIWRQLKTEAK